MDVDAGILLENDSTSILEAARTVSLAFSQDPLIRWLRPCGTPWDKLDSSSMRWQRRRLRRAIHEGIVFRLTDSDGQRFKERKSVLGSDRPAGESGLQGSREFGAIAVLSPPQRRIGSKLNWMWSWVQLQFLDIVDPVEDEGVDLTRVETMLKSHDEEMAQLRQQLLPRVPWYVEIIAVRPSLHGEGLGGKLLRLIIDMSKGEPIILECTSRVNTEFYKKFGFEMVKEVELESVNPREVVSVFFMVRR